MKSMQQVACVAVLVFAALLVPHISAAHKNTKPQGPAGCALCKRAVEKIETQLGFDDFDEAQFLADLAQRCQDTFANNPVFLDTCLGLVNTTVREVIDLLEQDLTPQHICEAAGACDPSKHLLKARGPTECNLCTESVKTLEELLDIGHMEDDIIANMTRGCEEAFADYPIFQDTCVTLVNTFVKDILDMIHEGLEPEHICELIGLCPPGPPPTTMPPPPPTTMPPPPPTTAAPNKAKDESPEGCELCKAAVTYVEHAMSLDDFEEEAFLADLAQGCQDIFGGMPVFLDTCLGLVNTTVRDVIDMLEEDLTPDHICEAVGACDPAKLVAKISGPAECVLCEESVKTLEELLEIGHMEDEIIVNLINDCIDAFGNYPIAQDTCVTLVNTFVKDILDLIHEGLEPHHICELIGLCGDEVPTTMPPPPPTTKPPPPPTTAPWRKFRN